MDFFHQPLVGQPLPDSTTAARQPLGSPGCHCRGNWQPQVLIQSLEKGDLQLTSWVHGEFNDAWVMVIDVRTLSGEKIMVFQNGEVVLEMVHQWNMVVAIII